MASRNFRKNIYKVVLNGEGEYSIWPAHKIIPAGWIYGGKTGRKLDCLEFIERVWTDMRPLSLRKAEEAGARITKARSQGRGRGPSYSWVREEPLVTRLLRNERTIHVSLRRTSSAGDLRESIDHGYVLVFLVGTRGGTEIGIDLDTEATDLTGADFARSKGTVHLVGSVTLDDVAFFCIADVDLRTLKGTGHLKPVVG